MIALDTNILVYAHRADSPFYSAASRAVQQLTDAPGLWALPWPCVHEFLSTITHPRVYRPPTSLRDASAVTTQILDVSNLVTLHETERHWDVLRELVIASQAVGPAIHDARIAAICIEHGVRELWSAHRDFKRFPGLRVVNPLRG